MPTKDHCQTRSNLKVIRNVNLLFGEKLFVLGGDFEEVSYVVRFITWTKGDLEVHTDISLEIITIPNYLS